MSDLTLDAAKHIYTLDGVVIPSVSEIMRFASREVYGKVDQRYLDVASERGTAVHEACERLDKTGVAEIEADYAPYLEAYAAFLRDEKPKWITIETACHQGTEYAGTLDRCGLLKGQSIPSIIDIKTASTLQPKLHRIQLAAYQLLWYSATESVNCYVLHLKKDATYKLKKIEPDFVGWQACLTLHTLFKKKRRNTNGKHTNESGE